MVSALGLGVAPLGNLYAEVSDEQAQVTLQVAERGGISWFDTAPLYGYGLAEQRLGQFLRNVRSSPVSQSSDPPWSSRFTVSTKVGRILEPAGAAVVHEHFVAPLQYRPRFDYSAAGIERSYEESLRRLGVERVQILLLHDIDRFTHVVGHRALLRQVLDEALPTLQRFKSEGWIDAIGLGVNEWDVGYEILASADVDCILLAGRYTLLDQSAFASGFLDACVRKRVAVLAGGVFNSGFLAGGDHFNYRPADALILARRTRLAGICRKYDVPLPAAALQFAAFHPAITSVTIGARSAQEVDEIIEWSRANIPVELWRELVEYNLIPEETGVA